MKKILIILTCMLSAAFIFSGCEDNDIFIDSNEPSVFYLNTAAFNMKNDNLTYTFTITWSKFKKEAGTIDLVFVPTGEVPATEGVDFTVSQKTFSFEAEEYTKTFTITVNKDDDALISKTFRMELANPSAANTRLGTFGAPHICNATIVVHPFAAMIGAVTITGEDYWDGVFTFVSEIEADDDDQSILWMGFNMTTPFGGPKDGYLTQLKVEETATEFLVSIPLPVYSGITTSGTEMDYVAAVGLDVNSNAVWDSSWGGPEDWGVMVDAAGNGVAFTLTASTPKDVIKVSFINGAPALYVRGDDAWFLTVPPPYGEFFVVMR